MLWSKGFCGVSCVGRIWLSVCRGTCVCTLGYTVYFTSSSKCCVCGGVYFQHLNYGWWENRITREETHDWPQYFYFCVNLDLFRLSCHILSCPTLPLSPVIQEIPISHLKFYSSPVLFHYPKPGKECTMWSSPLDSGSASWGGVYFLDSQDASIPHGWRRI